MERNAFVDLAREVLHKHLPAIGDYTEYRADVSKVAGLSLLQLLALERRIELRDDLDFELIHVVSRALEALGIDAWEQALVSTLRAPDWFDITMDDAYRVKVVIHPVYGVGIVQHERALDGSYARGMLHVTFADGVRLFTGDERRWSSAREQFTREAAAVLIRVVPAAQAEELWIVAEGLQWGGGRAIDELATELARRVPYLHCIGVHQCVWELAFALQKRIERWEQETGRKLPCGDDNFGDLASHIVGLGRAAYEATFSDPALALDRAERSDYRASFAYVFQVAESAYADDEIIAALRDHAPQRLVEHPRLGAGIRRDNGDTLFVTRVVPG